MPQTIEVKWKGAWRSLTELGVYTSTEDVRGYLLVRFSTNELWEFRPVEWRILED